MLRPFHFRCTQQKTFLARAVAKALPVPLPSCFNDLDRFRVSLFTSFGTLIKLKAAHWLWLRHRKRGDVMSETSLTLCTRITMGFFRENLGYLSQAATCSRAAERAWEREPEKFVIYRLKGSEMAHKITNESSQYWLHRLRKNASHANQSSNSDPLFQLFNLCKHGHASYKYLTSRKETIVVKKVNRLMTSHFNWLACRHSIAIRSRKKANGKREGRWEKKQWEREWAKVAYLASEPMGSFMLFKWWDAGLPNGAQGKKPLPLMHSRWQCPLFTVFLFGSSLHGSLFGWRTHYRRRETCLGCFKNPVIASCAREKQFKGQKNAVKWLRAQRAVKTSVPIISPCLMRLLFGSSRITHFLVALKMDGAHALPLHNKTANAWKPLRHVYQFVLKTSAIKTALTVLASH